MELNYIMHTKKDITKHVEINNKRFYEKKIRNSAHIRDKGTTNIIIIQQAIIWYLVRSDRSAFSSTSESGTDKIIHVNSNNFFSFTYFNCYANDSSNFFNSLTNISSR